MNVIRVHNKIEEELVEIGRRIGENFTLKKSGIETVLLKECIVKTFQIMTEFYYYICVLYTNLKSEDGFLAFWIKEQKYR